MRVSACAREGFFLLLLLYLPALGEVLPLETLETVDPSFALDGMRLPGVFLVPSLMSAFASNVSALLADTLG
jgi:hypothetical protein